MVPGNDKIGEDNNYKYFGAYFSRNLRLSVLKEM
jgi:hypothetical protein